MKPKALASSSGAAGELTGADHRRLGELRNLLGRIGTKSLESFAAGSAFDVGLESVGLEHVRDEGVSALRKLQEGKFDQITDAEAVELEAIVQREVFPVAFIVDGRFEALPVPWQHFNSGPICERIVAAIPSVGRVEYLADDGTHAEPLGTGFIVGDRLMMTSRSVAEVFVNGSGVGPFTFKSGRSSVFDLGREMGFSPMDLSGTLRITRIRMVHPYWDMALMDLDHIPRWVKPLLLSVLAPEEMQDREIAKIGYPAVLGRNDRLQQKGAELEMSVLRNVGGVKRLVPGTAKGRLPISSYGQNVPALHYETSAVASAGTGGAPLLDVLSGQVIGIGFASTGFSGSYAVPTYDLACDPRVVDAGVAFAGSSPAPASQWASFWKPPKKPKIGTTRGGTTPQPAAEQEQHSTTNLPQPYPDGSIAERLAQLRLVKKTAAPGDGADSVQRFRRAAAVLVAFNPEKLQPIDQGPVTDRAAAMDFLQIDLIRNPFDEDGNMDDRLWSLDTGPRIQALRDLQTAEKMWEAQAANGKLLPNLPLQKLLNRAIAMNPPFDPDQMDVAELTALATISGWLQDTEPGNALPNPVHLLQLIERRRDRALLNRLTSDTFTGREDERALIQAHLNSEEPRLLFVSGVGGMGKSALISRALLDWEGLELGQETVPAAGKIWVRVDMDHSLVDPNHPRSVLDQAAQQMIRSHPELQSLLQRYSQESQQLRRSVDQSRLEAGVESDDRDADRFAEILGSTLSQPGNRVAFWLDTFEEAQFLGLVVAERLLRLAIRLTTAQPRLRLIIAGRVPPPAVEKFRQEQERSEPTSTAGDTVTSQALQVFTLPEPPLQALLLRALPQSSAAVLLEQLLKRQSQLQGVTPPDPELVDAAAKILGGNPLTLRLAAPVLQAQGKAGLRNLAKLREDVRQKQLISRVVTHLHDKDLDKLLLPGLEVRIITPDVVRDVLARPCKLGRLSEAQAWTLFDKLRREITLVEPEREGTPEGREALRYRQDIRLIMVGDQQGKLTSKARQIHENAVGWWQPQKGPLARAEELYHRLRLGQPAAKLNQHWDAEAGRLLRSTLDELPIRSAQYIWLANKLNVGLETARTARIGQAAWEQQTATEVQRLLLGNQPEQALTLLGKRSKRLAGSPLYAMESRAHLFAGQERQAAAVAKKGIEACRKVSKPATVDLALLAAFIHERLGQFPTAEKMAAEAVGLAQAANDETLILSSLLRARRLQRLAWERKGRKGRLPPPSPSIEEAASTAGDHNLRKNPSVLRELAAELGASHPNFLTLAADVLLEDLLKAQSKADLTNWMDRQDMLTAEELRIFLAAGRQHEIISLAHSRIDERLHLPFTPNLVPFYEALRDLFREDVNAALHRMYQARKPEPAAARAAAKGSHPKHKKTVVSKAGLAGARAAAKANRPKHKGTVVRKPEPAAARAAAKGSHPKQKKTVVSNAGLAGARAAASLPAAPAPGLQSFVSKWREPLVGVLSRLKTTSRGTIMRFVLEYDDSLLARGRVHGPAVATDMFDHALKLQRLPELLRSLKSSLTGDDLRVVEEALVELPSA